MADEQRATKVKTIVRNNNARGAIYGLGVIDALVYYLQHATTFLLGLIGIIKAVFWPAMTLYKVLEIIKM